MFPFFPFPLPFFLYLSQNITNCWFRILPTLYHTQQGFFLGITVFFWRRFPLGGVFFAWWLVFRSAAWFLLGGAVFAGRRGFPAGAVFSRRPSFLLAAPFSLGGSVVAWYSQFSLGVLVLLGVAVFAGRCFFLLEMGFLFSTDFPSWLLPVAARSVLCSLSFHFPSPCSFTHLKILLTTGLGYCLPYIILSKVFFSAARFSLGACFLSVECFAARSSLGKAVFSWRPGLFSAARFSLGVAVLARRCCFLLGLGFLLSTDFGSWLLPVAARSGLCSLSFLFFSPLSFSELKILLTTGLGYCLPYIIPGKIFLSAPRFSLGAGLLSAARVSLGSVALARRRRGFLQVSLFSIGSPVCSAV